MSTAEIKKTKLNLIAWIEDLSDSDMLSVLDNLRNVKSQSDWYADLPPSQQQHINEGLDDDKNGRIIASGVFWKNLKDG